MQYNINASEDVNKMLKFASDEAIKYNAGQIATEYLIFGILCIKNSNCAKILNNYGVYDLDFEDVLAESQCEDEIAGLPELTPKSKQVFVRAQNLAKEVNSKCVDLEHILFSVLINGDCVAINILDKVFNVNILELQNKLLEIIKKQAVIDAQKNEQILQKNSQNLQKTESTPQKQPKKAEQNKPENPLADLGIDLTEKARIGKIDPIIGRDKEILRMIEILCRKTKNNPCLVGEAGVGKSAVVEGLALKIIEGDVPQELKNKTIFSFDISGLMSGTKFRGALEQKLRNAIDAILKNGNIIIFMDEIHTLVQTSGEKGEVSPADILKPYLARGEIRTIGATTNDEYRKFIERDKALERRFQKIMVNPPTKQDTYQILQGIRDSYENFHGVKISDDALKSAIELSDRYITDRNFPDKAIDLIDEASAKAKTIDRAKPNDIVEMEKQIFELQKKKKQCVAMEDYEGAIPLRDKIFSLRADIERLNNFYGTNQIEQVVGSDDIADVVSLWTSIPVSKLTESETQKLLNLENILHKRVIGQDEAIENVARAIRRSRVGLKTSKRPIGSFLFLGPTGVGKTELSKAVAEALFDDENNIIRLDMSEYMEPNSISKLIGSPPGYVGFEDGGQLTERVKQKPYSVVLFDEIEKANPEVLNMLLQVLDDGRLTDSQGRLINFQNTIIILTSNIGSVELQDMIKNCTDQTQRDDIIQKYLQNYLRPELINRIDNISLFKSLDKESLAKIAKIMLTNLVKTLNKQNINIRLTSGALEYLITKGYNQEFGARPLRRLIEQEIEAVISDAILCGEFKDKSGAIIDAENGRLKFDFVKNFD